MFFEQLLQQVASTLYNAPESDGDEHEVEMSARSQNTAPLPPTQQCPQLMRPSALHHQVWIITIITIINHNCHHHYHHHYHYYYCQQEQEQEQEQQQQREQEQATNFPYDEGTHRAAAGVEH